MLRIAVSLLFCIFCSASAEVETEIPFGIEAVTGFRSDLVERGFKLGENILDVQLQSELTIDDEWSIGFGALHATASGSSSYEESRGYFQVICEDGALRYGWHAAYRDVQSDIWRDGWETGPFVSLALHDDVAAGIKLLYDHGAQGYYGEANLTWSYLVSESSFLTLDGGAGVVADYYGRDGVHDLHMRLAYTYNVAKNVSFTPFLGGSLGIHEAAVDQIYSGIWLEVTF
jgi:hypothetical protein